MADVKKEAKQEFNIYQKLIYTRSRLLGIEKGGKTQVGGNRNMKYFELSDISPVVTSVGAEIGLIPIMTMTADLCILRIYDADKPEDFIEFTSPMSTADMRGCQPVQSLGAVHTYMRRYMYLLAFDIIEADQLEPRIGEVPEGKSEYRKPRDVKEIAADLQRHSIEKNGSVAKESYAHMLRELGIASSAELTEDMFAKGLDLLDNYIVL